MRKIVNRPTPTPAAVRAKAVAVQAKPVAVQAKPVAVQASSLRVSSPKDASEVEAEAIARKVMHMRDHDAAPRPAGSVRRFVSPYVSRFAPSIRARGRPLVARKAEGQPNVASNVAAELTNSLASGSPLPLGVRRFMEPRFGADFSEVRVHTGDRAAALSRRFSAQAFTVGKNIFFGKGRYQPDSQHGRHLIAHELTHTMQQGASPRAPPAVDRREEIQVNQHSPPQVQRLGIGDALSHFADAANNIPGWRMFTIVLGFNPITMSSVDRSPTNILRAAIEFLPGGHLVTQALDNHGILDRVANWVAQQIASLGMAASSFKQAIDAFLDTLSWTDIFDLGGVWNRAKRILTAPVDRLISFVRGLVAGIIAFIKEAILAPIGQLARAIPGYDLLCAVLGFDPVTGQPVPATAETLIGGFMKLIGQEAVWARMQESRAIPRAFAWFRGAMAAVVGFVRQIPTLFVAAFRALEIADLVLLPRAFAKLRAVFGGFVGQFISWAGTAVWNLLEIIFDVVSPGAFSYVKRTGAALRSILSNPLPFVGNLVRAAKAGFQNFATNFLQHLRAGLFDWLLGELPGVYIPRALTLVEIVKFVFSVLGLTWQNVRSKLVRVLTEPVVRAMEAGFDIVVALVRGGPAAAWDTIKEQLGNLRDTVIGGIINMVVEAVVTKAVPKLIAMFVPGAGFISAIISIYDTIMVFVQRISRIVQVVMAFINSIVAIAAGQIGAAARRVESILAGLLSLAISFLAGFAGLGRISGKVREIIGRVRATVDRGIDFLVNWVVTKARQLFSRVFGRTPSEAEAVKTEAQQRLTGMVGTLKDERDLRAAVDRIQNDLRGRGLKRFYVVALGEEEFDAIAEASAPKKSKVKKVGRDKTATVTVNATVTFNRPPRLRERFGSVLKRDAQGNPVIEGGVYVMAPDTLPATIESVTGYGKLPSAVGGIIQPKAPDSPVVQLKTWNTGDPTRGSSASHAESQAANWISSADPSSNVVEVRMALSGRYSPCPGCAGTLTTLGNTLRQRFAAVKLHIDFSSVKWLYPDWSDAGQCRSAHVGWQASGDPPKMPEKLEVA